MAAEGFVSARASGLGGGAQASIVDEALRVLADPEFAGAFGPASRAEVAIVAELEDPARRAPPIKVTGHIDRLADLPDGLLILDFKTNRLAPVSAETTPEAYVLQLAAYRAVIREIYPDRPVRAGLLWTVGPRLIEIPAKMLERAESQLWSQQRVQV